MAKARIAVNSHSHLGKQHVAASALRHCWHLKFDQDRLLARRLAAKPIHRLPCAGLRQLLVE
eukprot:5182354-Prorocentrum_lima.AAC.1